MTIEEEVAALRQQVVGVETVSQILNGSLLALLDRLERDERWLLDVSTMVRHLTEHVTAMMQAETPAPASKKDTQRGMEVA